ncbi:hypothetical protein BKA57DRAFT_448796 [Linnemannia elongata]|nr:hypothetical protein BKA57DRAFT_448796 [Linnemannia elongata]
MQTIFLIPLSLLSSLFSSFVLVFLLSLSYTFILPLAYLIPSHSPSLLTSHSCAYCNCHHCSLSSFPPLPSRFSLSLFSPRVPSLLLSLLHSD